MRWGKSVCALKALARPRQRRRRCAPRLMGDRLGPCRWIWPGERAEQINESILTDADTQQTTIDRLAAQLDSARSENADLARKLEQLCGTTAAHPGDGGEPAQTDLGSGWKGKRSGNSQAGFKQLEVQLERLQEQSKTATKERGGQASRSLGPSRSWIAD